MKSILTSIASAGGALANRTIDAVKGKLDDLSLVRAPGSANPLAQPASPESTGVEGVGEVSEAQKHAAAVMAMLPKLLENWLALGVTALNQSNRRTPVLLLFADDTEPTVGEVCRKGKPVVVIPQGRFANIYFTKQQAIAQENVEGVLTHVSQEVVLVEPAMFKAIQAYCKQEGLSLSLKKIPVKNIALDTEELVAGLLFEQAEN